MILMMNSGFVGKKYFVIIKKALEIKNTQILKDKIYNISFKGYPKQNINYALMKNMLQIKNRLKINNS